MEKAKVYFTKEITPESLIKIYDVLGVKLTGNIGIKVSTGESGSKGYLKADLIGPLVNKLDGTIIECNTAYPGKRTTTKEHLKVAKEHGFVDMGKGIEILDGLSEFKIPVNNGKHLEYDIIGEAMKKYDSFINLAHGKGHAMGGEIVMRCQASMPLVGVKPVKHIYILVEKLKVQLYVGFQNMNKKILLNQWQKQQKQYLII